MIDSGSWHGGPDAQGVPRWDFSTNANACGPAPMLLPALRQADVSRYPDPAYRALREALAALHGVAPERIVIAASASEFITRMTAAVAQAIGAARVHVPWPGYRDYARAAAAWGLPLAPDAAAAHLVWHTEPGSPGGEASCAPPVAADALLVIDQAYAPLRLEGAAPPLPANAWRLLSPNKALGLTGVRGAYAIAPPQAGALQQALARLAPSWPVGAQGVVMLQAWARPDVQQWVAQSLPVLREWKAQQQQRLESLGWTMAPSVTPFFVARWHDELPSIDVMLLRLRARGLKLRETSSLGLPGRVRISVQPPQAQEALAEAWHAALAEASR